VWGKGKKNSNNTIIFLKTNANIKKIDGKKRIFCRVRKSKKKRKKKRK